MMYKSTSQNQQNRAVRAILNRRENDQLDESVFSGVKDTEARKTELVHQMKAIDARIGVLNAHIQRADAVRKAGGGATPAKTYGGWKIERSELVVERGDLEAKVRELSKFSKATRDERLSRFDNVFVDMAREMLAAEVFQRIQIATVHRLAEREAAEAVAS